MRPAPFIYVATHNPNKVRELSALARAAKSTITLRTLPNLPEIDETGATFRQNAILKARAAWEHCRRPVIAEDSGLEVFSLKRQPGIFSARFSGPNATAKTNNRKLQRVLRGKRSRRARFVCVMVYYDGRQPPKTFRGTAYGTIVEGERGSGGFGYDPLFYYHPFRKTFGELPLELKQTISHRGRAFRKLLKWLTG